MVGSEVLIAAGGSGQEVAAAAMRLAYLAGLDLPDIVVIDSDIAPGSAGTSIRTRSQVLADLNQRLRRTHVIARDRVRFLNPATLPKHVAPLATVDSFFADAGHVDRSTDDLLNLFLDKKQRGTRVDNGFHGQPALGSLVFSASASSEASEFSSLFDNLREQARTANGLRVVLVGSVSGGVGTAAIPILVREMARIRSALPPDRVRIGAMLFWPWFRLAKMHNDSDSRAPDVEQAELDRNATSLLRGYLDQILVKSIDALLLLGLPRTVERTSHGGDRQPETPHYLNVCAGIQALNMLSADRARAAFGTAADPRGLFGMTLAGGANPSALDGPPAGPALMPADGPPCTVQRLIDVARCLEAFTEAIRFELKVEEPVPMHHGAIASRLKRLKTPHQRLAFVRAIEELHLRHVECRTWLDASLQAMVGGNRADTIQAFEGLKGWPQLFDTGYSAVHRRLGGKMFAIETSRRLISKLGPFPESGTEDSAGEAGLDGSKAAWALVKQARAQLLRRL